MYGGGASREEESREQLRKGKSREEERLHQVALPEFPGCYVQHDRGERMVGWKHIMFSFLRMVRNIPWVCPLSFASTHGHRSNTNKQSSSLRNGEMKDMAWQAHKVHSTVILTKVSLLLHQVVAEAVSCPAAIHGANGDKMPRYFVPAMERKRLLSLLVAPSRISLANTVSHTLRSMCSQPGCSTRPCVHYCFRCSVVLIEAAASNATLTMIHHTPASIHRLALSRVWTVQVLSPPSVLSQSCPCFPRLLTLAAPPASQCCNIAGCAFA